MASKSLYGSRSPLRTPSLTRSSLRTERLTLAEQLSQIAQPAPQDYDPEEAYATYADGRSLDQANNAAHQDYVDAGTSKLRKKGEAVLDAKYDGKKGSRAAIFGGQSDDSDEGEEEEDLPSGDDDDDDDEMGSFEDLEGGEEDDDSEEEDHQDEDVASGDGDGDEDDDEEEEEEAPRPKKSNAAPSTNRAKVQDERVMVSQLKQAASADVEKGRAVKKQLAFCDSLLESRIKLQKAVGASNLLPHPDQAPAYYQAVGQDDVDETLRELAGLSEELFELRQGLLAQNEKIELPADFGASRKRKRTSVAGDETEYLDAMLDDLHTLETTFDPFLRATVTKWSDKVLAASGLAGGGSGKGDKKFKAVNQNAMAQIDHALSATGERERLVRRTKVRRGEGKPVGGVGAEAEKNIALTPLEEGEKETTDRGTKSGGNKEVDDECFDDSDFYQQLLRDVVESRMLDLDDATMTQLRHATALARGKKVKKVVDTRASKGRKIRYHVHEKVQNFMIPIEAGNWHDEQIDELFASLLGKSFPQANGGNGVESSQQHLDPALDDVPNQAGGQIEVGSLRLFG
ncbi:TRAUB-domain-containing protein [Rhodotorula sp. JG-1b]|nr:TRAUB-domain-containing protein [Rhodotorula sp. JG-1b]